MLATVTKIIKLLGKFAGGHWLGQSYRYCKRNFKWPSMQRWQCPIHNGIMIKNVKV